jgi:ABC-2 type transport system ATP-binding protein
MISTIMRRIAGPVIDTRALERWFGPRPALAGVDVGVGAGEVHGLLGPGRAGKTTLLRVLAGLLAPTSGTARVLGWPSTSAELRGRVGLVTVDGTLSPGLCGIDNLVLAGRLRGMNAGSASDRALAVLQQVGLARAGERPVGAWSPGMRLRLAFARALLTNPQVLLIDEPPAGIDPATSAAVRALVSSHARSGTTVLWATRRLDELQGLATSLTLLAGGRVRYAGSVETLAERALAVAV